MKLTEMKAVAADTLTYFLEVMPEPPFVADDIIIEFASKSNLVKCVRSFCKQYAPDKTFNESQVEELENSVDANAFIGREKSAVIVRINYNLDEQSLRSEVFHELAHIFCAKREIDGDHFIDIYGSGTTPERPDMDFMERAYDGYLVAGHQVWSEFIAQYYALKYTEETHPSTEQAEGYINHWLTSVGTNGVKGDKYALAFACARWLTCYDGDKAVESLKNGPDEPTMQQMAFEACLFLLHDRVSRERPWEITEDFIADLGQKFLIFKTLNLGMM
jgi:hypothetical protein